MKPTIWIVSVFLGLLACKKDAELVPREVPEEPAPPKPSPLPAPADAQPEHPAPEANFDAAPPTAADQALIDEARRIPASRLLVPDRRAKKPLRGTIGDYVTEVIDSPELGAVLASVIPCTQDPSRRCVKLDGDPCVKNRDHDGDCEGMYLSVWIDMSASPPRLDRAEVGSGDAVTTQAEIDEAIDRAP